MSKEEGEVGGKGCEKKEEGKGEGRREGEEKV
jgi:hypothetical protein